MWRVTPPGYVHEYGETRAARIDEILGTGSDRLGAASPPSANILFLSDARAPLRQIHVPEGRSGLAAARRRRAQPPQARVPGRVRGLRRRAPAARVLAGRHARRRGHDAAQPGDEPRAHPRVPRPARAERADEVVRGPVLVPGSDQAVRVLGRVTP